MILTEQEIRKLQTQHPTENNPMPFARAIETLIEERLKAQEPVAKIVVTTSSRYKKGTINVTSYCDSETEFKPHETGISEMFLYPHPLPPDDVVHKYEELLYAVHRKFPDETRHQTALRYIKTAESPSYTNAARRK